MSAPRMPVARATPTARMPTAPATPAARMLAVNAVASATPRLACSSQPLGKTTHKSTHVTILCARKVQSLVMWVVLYWRQLRLAMATHGMHRMRSSRHNLRLISASAGAIWDSNDNSWCSLGQKAPPFRPKVHHQLLVWSQGAPPVARVVPKCTRSRWRRSQGAPGVACAELPRPHRANALAPSRCLPRVPPG